MKSDKSQEVMERVKQTEIWFDRSILKILWTVTLRDMLVLKRIRTTKIMRKVGLGNLILIGYVEGKISQEKHREIYLTRYSGTSTSKDNKGS